MSAAGPYDSDLDVRQIAGSRRRGFSKTALREALAGAGIDYRHLPELGNPKPIRDLFKSGAMAAGEAAYRHHLRTEQRPALERLVVLLGEGARHQLPYRCCAARCCG